MSDTATGNRLRKKLREQIGFLQPSVRDYDAGHQDEALTLATTMRVLFHETPISTSVLTHRSMRSTATMLATPPTHFADWWESDSATNATGTSVSRKQIILGSANKDGGANVDAELQSFYEHLIRRRILTRHHRQLDLRRPSAIPQGVTMWPSNGHLALLRQFVHETLTTATHYRWLL
jgi:hypothetical protein